MGRFSGLATMSKLLQSQAWFLDWTHISSSLLDSWGVLYLQHSSTTKTVFQIPRGLYTNNPEISQRHAFLMFLNVFHWPHLVDDFGLLKCHISTFLAQDMRLTWLKITQFGRQIWWLGSQFSLLWRQKGRNPKKHPFPWNCHFAALMMGTKIAKFQLV